MKIGLPNQTLERTGLSRNNSVAEQATIWEPLMDNEKFIDSHTGSGSPNSDRLH